LKEDAIARRVKAGFAQKVLQGCFISLTAGLAAFFAVSLRLTEKGFFPRGYASALVSRCNSEGVEAEPRTNTAVFGKPEAYRKDSGEAVTRLNETSLEEFLCKAVKV
jgi:hypothetical protein